MALAETAVLAVELKLNGGAAFKSGMAEADAAAASLGKTASSTGNILGGTASNFSLVKTAAKGLGTEVAAMGSHLKGVLTGPLGLLGLGAGLFTVAGLLKSGTEEASSFGLEVAKLSALTGLSVETTSALASALDHFGISGDAAVKTVGMLTKNIGNIVNSKAGLAGFATTFNLSLTDTKGHLVDVNEEILRTADYFNNKSIPATEKAAALSKLYGKQWQTLIPFLAVGRKGILDAEQAAKDLGLIVTKQNVGDLARYRESFLKLGDATKGLQLQLGLVLIPLLSDLATSFTTFLAKGGTAQIVTAFKGLVENAKDFGRVITGTVIPTIQGLATTATGFWNAIPAPLRDILAKGFIADRTIHFLLGVSPIHLVTSLVGDVLGPVIGKFLGGFAQRGGTPANPLFVANVTGGLGGGLPGAGGGGAGAVAGAGIFQIFSVAAIAAIAAQTAADITNAQFDNSGHPQNLPAPGSGPLPFGISASIDVLAKGINILLHQDQFKSPGAPSNANQSGSPDDRQAKNDARLATQRTKDADSGPLRQSAKDLKEAAAAHKAAAKALSAAAPKIEKTAASHDKETSAAIATIIKQAKATAILATAAQHDREQFVAPNNKNFVPTVKLDASQITDLRKTATASDKTASSMETLRGAIGTKLAAAETASRNAGTTAAGAATRAGSGIIAAIHASRPITNVQVNVSATSVQHKTSVVTRYGPTGGTRNTGVGGAVPGGL